MKYLSFSQRTESIDETLWYARSERTPAEANRSLLSTLRSSGGRTSTRDSNSEHLTASAIVTGSASSERRVRGPWVIPYPAGARDDGLTTILSERRGMQLLFIAA